MSGTIEGGKKCAARNKELYGEDFYKNIGKLGGAKSRTGGFYWAVRNVSEDDPRHPRTAGNVGGKLGKRKAKNELAN